MNILQKIIAVWRNVGVVQRVVLTTITLMLIGVTVLLVNWVQRPDMRLLYNGLEPEEASKMTEKITEKGVKYELRSGGTAIYVPKETVYQLRLDMAKEGLPAGAQGGYKIFDDEKIGISPFVQSVNLQRALQDELAKSIQMIDGVLFCRVHIVKTEQPVFTSDTLATSASVVLKLRAGFKLTGQNIAAITHLVAGSVEGLKPEAVTVVDSDGRLLSSQSDKPIAAGASTVQDYKERVEQSLSEKAEKMLTSVLGPGRAIVRVSAVIDMTSVNLMSETYDPAGKVTSKEEIKSNSETEASTASATAGQPATPGGVKKDETIVTEYKVAKKVEQKVELPGQVKTLSVAAFVDLTPADANAATAGGGKLMEVADVEQIIKNALGLRDTDTLKVVSTRFYQPAQILDNQKPAGRFDFAAIARNISLAVVALCSVVVLKIFGGAKKKAAEQGGAGEKLPAALPAGNLPAVAGENYEPTMLRRQIATALKNNPDQVKKLFSSWMKEQEV